MDDALASATASAMASATASAPSLLPNGTVSLSGTVFTDSNDDGRVDGTDQGRAGVTVQLLSGGQPTGASATTDANGAYAFTGLAPGSYSVHVVAPATSGLVFSPLGSNTPPQPSGGALTPAQNMLANGSFETTGANTTALGFAGWTVSANTPALPYGSGPGDGPEIALTNGKEAYAIDPAGRTNPYASNPVADNAEIPYEPYSAAGASGAHAAFFVDDGAIQTLSQTVNLVAGQAYELGFDLQETTPGQNNPGYFQLTAAIGGQTITTAGSISGTRLVPGSWTHFADLYTPTMTGPQTLSFTYQSGVPGSSLASKDVLVDDVYIVPGQTTANLTTTSEVDASGNTAPVTLTAGQTVGNESAGLYVPPATIAGTVFTDTNGDGAQGASEAGLAGQTVNLASGGTIVATAVTDAQGGYRFASQPAGTYTVSVVEPSSRAFSPAGASQTQTVSTVAAGGTQTVTVASGATARVNAGVYVPATVAGTVFADANADGVQQGQGTEQGIGGQTVQLLAGGIVVATTTTASNGTYAFANRVPGTYTVQVAVPAADAVSMPGTSATLTDSTAGPTGAQGLVLASGGTAIVNAGLFVASSVAGSVFTDANADGTRQAVEAGLSGVPVNLLASDGHILATTTSAADGSYRFAGVAPGADTVAFVAPHGDVASTPLTRPVTVTPGSDARIDAGLYAPASVGGTVFSDLDADGTQAAGEPGVAGQTVTLLAAAGQVVATTTTGADGGFAFQNLVPGSYTVQTAAPAGEGFSPVGNGAGASTIGSGGTQAIALASGGAAVVNAGEFGPGTVQGLVFADANADGAMQPAEQGRAGIAVQLLGADGHVIAATTTGTDGAYAFAGVAPGHDTIRVVRPDGTSFSPVGSSATLPDSTVAADGTAPATVVSLGSTTIDAGIYVSTSIASRVFVDGQADGIYHVGDPGVPNVAVALLKADGTPTGLATTTDANGNYAFANIVPGTYEVRVALPGGTAATTPGAGPDGALDSEATASASGFATTPATTVFGGIPSHAFNAGLLLTGTATGAGQSPVDAGLTASFNDGGHVIVGAGSDNVHTNAGDNFILIGPGSNVFETGPGNDTVLSRGATNAQALGVSDRIFGGPGGGVLQGGAGSDYLVAGTGPYTLAGGAGPATLVTGPGGGTLARDGQGAIAGYTVGDEVRPGAGAATILVQSGDGVVLLDTFRPGRDSLTVYGHAGVAAVSRANGHTVLDLGGGDAIVFNDAYDTASGTYPGIAFSPAIPAAPTLVEYPAADGTPTLGAPGSAPKPSLKPVLEPAPQPTPKPQPAPLKKLSASAAGATLQAPDGDGFTLEGGPGQATLTGGAGAQLLLAHGTANTITAGDGANTVVTGAGSDRVTAGAGANTIFVNGDGNTVSAGDGDNTVVLIGAGHGDSVTLGNGRNSLFAFGGGGETITAGTGANTVFAAISDSTINLGAGLAFVFGDGNRIDVAAPGGGVVAVSGAGNATTAGDGAFTVFQSGGSVALGTGTHGIFITGTAVVITAGRGDNVVLGPAGGANVTLGAGTQLVGLAGHGNTVSLGDGDSTVFLGDGGGRLSLGSGHATVVVAGGGNTVALGADPSLGSADIYGFVARGTGGDLLDLSRVLGGASLAGVTLSSSGADTLVSVARGSASLVVADLHGVGSLSMAQLAH